MSVRIKSLNTNMWKQGDEEGNQEFSERKRNAWKVILDGIIKPMDRETVLILQEVPGVGTDKEFSSVFRRNLDAAGCDHIERFQTPHQKFETVVVAKRGLIGEIDSIPHVFGREDRKNRYVPFVIHDEVRDINALAVHGANDPLTPAAEIAQRLTLLESWGTEIDLIAGDFNSGLNLSLALSKKDLEKLENRDDYLALLYGEPRFRDVLGDIATYRPKRDEDPLTSVDHILVGRGLTARDVKRTFIDDEEEFMVAGHVFDHALVEAVISPKR